MSLHYVIDGYNIIKHTRFNQQIKNKFQDSKSALLEFIKVKKLCGSTNNRITVIFDGYPDNSYLKNDTNIEVIFARGESADERIMRMVKDSSSNKNMVVVTDDKEIRLFAKSYRTKVQGIEEFIGRKEKSQRRVDDSLKPEITYSMMHKINQELRKIWLK
jgi:predicted RNA-binding protein with PIN domain